MSDYILDNLFVLIFTIFVAYHIFQIHKNALDRANQEIAFSRELNQTLEEKVRDRTAQLQKRNELLQNIGDSMLKAQEKMWSEIELAEKIQSALLPVNAKIDGYEIVAYINHIHEVGGDYYDVINTDKNDWLVIGDVAGHGVPAGLFMMMVGIAIHNTIEQHPDIDPKQLLVRINRTLYNSLERLQQDYYMTITVFACDKKGTLVFSGLHQQILICRYATKLLETIDSTGFWIGVTPDIDEYITNDTLQLFSNDIMLLYSDGLTEAWRVDTEENNRSPLNDMYGEKRLKKTFMENAHKEPEGIKDAIMQSLADYKIKDDITIVIIKKT